MGFAELSFTFLKPSGGFWKTLPCSWVVIRECSGSILQERTQN